MSAVWSSARAALRAHRSSATGSFLIVVAAAALLSANGVLLETGLRVDAPLLSTVAGSFAGTAILVVVLVVASTFSSALRQRSAQFALLRAIGATPSQIRSMITAEVVLVFAVAAPLGAVPGLFAAGLLTPALEAGGVMPAGSGLSVSPLPALSAVLLLLPTALLAARLAARTITRVSPTAAVRGSNVEPSALSPARRITAIALLATGLLIAGTPFVMPGTVGSAAGATSAFLLISAAALAGPALIAAAGRRAVAAGRSSRSAAGLLALVNVRGFARRLTAAIIPLALLLALGTVQTGVNGSAVDAAGMQLRDGLGSDLVITSPGGVTPEQAAAVASTAGIEEVVGTSVVAAEVRVDSEDDLGGLSWEQTSVRAIDGSPAGLIDVQPTAGSLDALGPGAIAVSSESLFATGKTVGDTVDVRFAGAPSSAATIVAVYERGLGFGDYLVDASSLSASSRADVLFARGSADLSGLGLTTLSVDDDVAEAVGGAASEQQLGAILLFVLLFFIAVAAGNTLVMLTGARAAEFALLRRVGATRRQLTSMIAIESALVALAALVIGTLSVIPALVGVGYGMLGSFSPAVDWPVYAGLGAAVVVIAVVGMIVPARAASRGGAGAVR